MGKFKDLTGQKFGRLTVVECAGKSKCGNYIWKCKCECGSTCFVKGAYLVNGNTKSCGCLRQRWTHTTHGLSKTPIYKVWRSMKERCLSPQTSNFADYGGRGIKICERWLNSFENFYEDVSKLPHFGEKGYSLDRIDNNGDYCPENVRWADRKTQCRNRRNNVVVEYQGRKMTLEDAVEKSKICRGTLLSRIKKGDTGDYLFRPVKSHK